ncbi:PKD domain-containing protein [Candidatus Hydrogenedentota bacterium]
MNRSRAGVLLLVLCLVCAFAQAVELHEPPDGRVIHGWSVQSWQTNPGAAHYQDQMDYRDAMNSNGTPGMTYRAFWSNLQSVSFNTATATLDDLLVNGIPGGFIMMSVGIESVYTDIPSGAYDEQLDTYIQIYHKYQDRPIIQRIGHEFNLHFQADKQAYIDAYRYWVSYVRARGVNNVAFTWDYYPTKTWNSNHAAWMDYYPGDSYVDWWGIDVFDPCDKGDAFEAQLHAYTGDAAARGKPVGVPECTPRKKNTSRTQTLEDSDWEWWYKGFFEWIESDGVKAVWMTNKDWRLSGTWSDWGDANIVNNAYVLANYKSEMQESKWIHNNDSNRMNLLGWDPQPEQPSCYFVVDAQSGPAPLLVNFGDCSFGFPDAWEWDFNNDGTVDSYEASPTYEYTQTGIYTVKLTVSNSHGTDSYTRINHVTVSQGGSMDTNGHMIINGDAENRTSNWTPFQWDPSTVWTGGAPTQTDLPGGNIVSDPTDPSNHVVELRAGRSHRIVGACARVIGFNRAGESVDNLGELSFRVYVPAGNLPDQASVFLDLDDNGEAPLYGEFLDRFPGELSEGWNTVTIDPSSWGESFESNDGACLIMFMFRLPTSQIDEVVYIDDLMFSHGTTPQYELAPCSSGLALILLCAAILSAGLKGIPSRNMAATEDE